MQCKPVTELPANGKWTFEIKFDGYRCIAVKRGRDGPVFSRNQKVLNKRFLKVVEALASLGGDFVFDGDCNSSLRVEQAASSGSNQKRFTTPAAFDSPIQFPCQPRWPT